MRAVSARALDLRLHSAQKGCAHRFESFVGHAGKGSGVICFFSATSLKHALGYDDSLDAFGVHGVGGTIGAVLTGVFAQAFFNPASTALMPPSTVTTEPFT